MKQRKLARLLLAAARYDVGRWIGHAEDHHTDPTACLLGMGFVTATESYVLSLALAGVKIPPHRGQPPPRPAPLPYIQSPAPSSALVYPTHGALMAHLLAKNGTYPQPKATSEDDQVIDYLIVISWA